MSSNSDYLFWVSVTHFVPQFGFICSTLLGTILLLLNNVGAQTIFGSYRHLISAFTTFGMVFATVEILVFPNVHNYNAGFLFFSFEDSLGLHGPKTRNIPLACYTFFHSATMSLLSVLFIYRYWALFDFPAMSIVAYDPVDGSVRWWNIMGILNICSIVNFQYGVMIYCGWTMHMRMEERIKNFSENMKKHHKQFFKSLVLQITTPTIILFIPITVIIFLPIFNFNVSFPSGVMLCSFTLYPAMDSLILMYVVSDYRKAARNIFTIIREVVKEMSHINRGQSIMPSEMTRSVAVVQSETSNE